MLIDIYENKFLIRTKIVCTIGPASSSYETLEKMAKAGMNIARFNFSHGSHEEHSLGIKHIREISSSIRKPIAILQDLPGSKIRIGKIKNEPISLKMNSIITLTIENILGNENKISVNNKDFIKMVSSGDIIFLQMVK